MLSVSLAVLLTTAGADPAAAPPTPEQVRRSVERSLAVLEKDGVAWMKEKKCASCHAVPLTLWSHHEARRHGFAIPQTAIDTLRKGALAEYANHPDLKPAGQEGKPGTLSVAPLYLMLAVAAAGPPDADTVKALDRFTAHLLAVQQADGSWGAPDGGPKATTSAVKDTSDVLTMYALLALASREPAPAAWPAGRDRGLAWLRKAAPSESNQALALRVLTRQRFGKAEEWRPLVRQLLARQNADGGWSQVPGGPSDALATGQALYALGTAGTPSAEPAVHHAWKFLVTTQRDDGSWLVHTRVAKGHDVIISHFGSGWATLGLVRTLPAAVGKAEDARPPTATSAAAPSGK
jgi:hypothetical protein